MPNIPAPPVINTSGFIGSLHVSAGTNGEVGFPDTIVVRGYLGPPSEDLERAGMILNTNGIVDQNNQPLITPAHILQVQANPANATPWRLYLSARGDCWVEIPNWERDVAACVAETSTDRVGAYTVWLRTLDADGRPVRYRVVTVDELDPSHDKFVAGRLVNDYMTQTASRNVVWDEQQFGPTTGKLSTKNCF